MRFPGLRRKAHQWQYRRPVPRDLRQLYGKCEIVIGLKTSDYNVARILAAEHAARLGREFERHRRGPGIKEIVMQGLVAPLANTSSLEEAKRVIEEGAAKQTSKIPLERLMDHWCSERNPSRKMQQEARRALKLLPLDLSAPEITRVHVVAARDVLASRASRATVEKMLDILSAVFQVCADDGVHGITSNPAARIRVRTAAKPTRRRGTWAPADIERFRAADDVTAGLRALFELGLWTGARLAELVGLRAEDVVLDAAVPYIYIRPHAGRRLKTEGATRRVPLVPQVLESARVVAAGHWWDRPSMHGESGSTPPGSG